MTCRLALVTGATRGIGRAICDALIAAGRTVIASGRDAAALDELVAAHGASVVPLVADLGEPGAWSKLVAQAERVGPVSELVSNAGIVRYAQVGEVSEGDLHAQLEVNFVVPFLMGQALGNRMRARGAGAIVNVASTLGFSTAPETAAYAASKAALISATRSFALELAPTVRVNAVAPGIVDTDMVRVPRQAAGPGFSIEAQLEKLSGLHPLGRLGTPQEVAEAVLFLLQARWVTGTLLTIDGGISLR